MPAALSASIAYVAHFATGRLVTIGATHDHGRSIPTRDVAYDRVRAHLAIPFGRERGARVGMAHGLAGELWAALQWKRDLDRDLEARLAELASLARAHGDGLLWPHRIGAPIGAPAVWWCHGAPGHALLWTEVAGRSHERRAVRDAELRARLAARATLALPAPTPFLCCGLAGQALALERFGRSQGDALVLRGALTRLKQASAA